MPSSFEVKQKDLLRIELMHGERFAGKTVAIDGGQIERYAYLTANGTSPIRLIDGMTQAFARPMQSGIIAYETNHYVNTLDAAGFEAYLAEEGLGFISEDRAARGELGDDGNEVYARFAKALVAVEDGAPPTDRAVGLELELVLLGTVDKAMDLDDADVNLAGEEERPPVRHVQAELLFRGQPLADARVVFVARHDPSMRQEATTNAKGIVTLPAASAIVNGGPVMLTSIHMVRTDSETKANTGADWESFWASLVFDASLLK